LSYQRPLKWQIIFFTIFCLPSMMNLIPWCRWLVLSLCNNFHLLKKTQKNLAQENPRLLFLSLDNSFTFSNFEFTKVMILFIEKIHFPSFFSKDWNFITFFLVSNFVWKGKTSFELSPFL
jgi:hypothetical protein